MNKHKIFSFTNVFISLLWIAGLIIPTSYASQSAMSPVQPLLLQMASTDPAQSVRVIVQKVAASQEAEAQVAALGGRVTSDLHIINAFAAEMTAGSAVELSRNEAVGWISLDAPVASTACPSCVDTSQLASAYIRTIRLIRFGTTHPICREQPLVLPSWIVV